MIEGMRLMINFKWLIIPFALTVASCEADSGTQAQAAEKDKFASASQSGAVELSSEAGNIDQRENISTETVGDQTVDLENDIASDGSSESSAEPAEESVAENALSDSPVSFPDGMFALYEDCLLYTSPSPRDRG